MSFTKQRSRRQIKKLERVLQKCVSEEQDFSAQEHCWHQCWSSNICLLLYCWNVLQNPTPCCQRSAHINPNPRSIKFIKAKTILSSDQKKSLKSPLKQSQAAVVFPWHYFHLVIQLGTVFKTWPCSPSLCPFTESTAPPAADGTFSTVQRDRPPADGGSFCFTGTKPHTGSQTKSTLLAPCWRPPALSWLLMAESMWLQSRNHWWEIERNDEECEKSY